MKRVALVTLTLILGASAVWAQAAKTLVYARGADCVTLDPHNILDGESSKVSEQIFEGLVSFKPGSTDVEPCLATSWTSSTDGLTWDFTLRQGVVFHDGSPLTPEAVVFSFRRQMDPKHPAHKGTFEYWGMFDAVQDVSAQKEGTVRFKLSRPYAPLLSNLAMFSAAIISPKSWETHGEKIFENPVGTGPWVFQSWRRGEGVTLVPNSRYWKKTRPGADRLVFKVVESSPIRLKMLQSGDADMADGISPIDIQRAEQDAALEVVTAVGMNVGYLAFNTSKKPFDDVRVREAMALAIDVERLAKLLYRGYGDAAASPLPPCLWGTDPSLKPRSPDLARAKMLLAQAGHAEGFKTTLVFGNNPRPYLPEPKKCALYIKSALRKIGIDATLEEMEWGAYLEHTKYGKHDMCLLGWNGDNGDPDNFLDVLLSSAKAEIPAMNLSFYKNVEVDAWLREAQKVADIEARTALYQKALRRIYKDVPMLPLGHARQLALVRRGVSGFRLHPNGVRAMPRLDRN